MSVSLMLSFSCARTFSIVFYDFNNTFWFRLFISNCSFWSMIQVITCRVIALVDSEAGACHLLASGYLAVDDVIVLGGWSRDVEVGEVLTLAVEAVVWGVAQVVADNELKVSVVISSLVASVVLVRRHSHQLTWRVRRIELGEFFLNYVCKWNTDIKSTTYGD